ncbi:hypothetical protein GCM10023149_01280 [Mucilaginibacter gynuensis]|uniref:Secreted protein n=1 Tax=Mucilaginibacter gynuensis TaxID=1302236 RepID=A0ABP8FNN1_9SPHI
MFRSFIAITLITALLISNFTRLFVYAGYELNKKYIAATLCENRDKPQMHCNGRCYLAKKIKQAEEKEKSQERESQKNHFQEAFVNTGTRFNFTAKLLQEINSPYLSVALPQHAATIFQPPRA